MKARIVSAILTVASVWSASAEVWPSSAVYSKPEKLGPHLYSIEFTRYEYGYANVYMTRVENAMMAAKIKAARAGGCSAVRQGDFVGRNFDWLYDETDEFLIRVPSISGERHASIGLSIATRFFPGQPLPSSDDEREYEMIPFFTTDGINDAGVLCECNLMPVDDVENDVGTRLTANTSRRLCESAVVRFVLDYAGSARHAVELLKQVTIRNLPQSPIAWMIADTKDTFVVEVVDNALKVIAGERAQLLTNFYLSLSPVCGKPYAACAGGIERYERLKASMLKVDSQRAMLDLLRSEFYSQMYAIGNELKWWSEMNASEYEDQKGVTQLFSSMDSKDPQTWVFQRRMKEFAADRLAFARCRDYEKRNGRREATDLWHTVHSAAYDLKNKTMLLRIQEQDKVYSFKL